MRFLLTGNGRADFLSGKLPGDVPLAQTLPVLLTELRVGTAARPDGCRAGQLSTALSISRLSIYFIGRRMRLPTGGWWQGGMEGAEGPPGNAPPAGEGAREGRWEQGGPGAEPGTGC